MSFTDAPLYLIAPEVRAKYYATDKILNLGNLSGGDREMVVVAADHWAVIDSERVYSVSDQAFKAKFTSIPGDERSFVEKGPQVKAVAERDIVKVENQNDQPLAEFNAAAVRLSSDGKPICRASWPIWRQAELLLAAGPGGASHIAALRSYRTMLGSKIIEDTRIMSDIHMFDAVIAGRKDRVGAGMAALHAAVPPSGLNVIHDDENGDVLDLDRKSVRASLSVGTGIHPLAFVDVRHTPTYTTEGFRALARNWLGPYLGERALEDTLVIALPTGDNGKEPREAVDRWLDTGEEIAVGPKASDAAVPGYETSEFRHFRFEDGVDAVVFEDIFGFYMYAWRTPGTPSLGHEGGKEEHQTPRLH